MNNKYSIIVPIYKVEKYLRSCIESILNQSFENFELILVDDGSPDKCGEICDHYAAKDDRIKVIHKSNGGRLSTWIAGLKLSCGDYIGSVDGDDFVDSDWLSAVNDVITACKGEVDIIVFGYRSVTGEGDRGSKNLLEVPAGYYDKKRIDEVIAPGLINQGTFENRSNVYLSRVNKIIKRELLLENEKYYYANVEYGEDNLWAIPNVLSAKGIYVMSDFYPYNYRKNPTSITHSYNKNLWESFCKLNEFEADILKEKGYENQIYQIYRDSVFHAAVAINNEMNSSSSVGTTIKNISAILRNEGLKKGLNEMVTGRCSSKERLNMFLMKHNLSAAIYIIKTIQKIIEK